MRLKSLLGVLLICTSFLSSGQGFKKFQQPFSKYTVNPDSCIRIQHPSGSLIFIEADAIITESKKINILYREYLTSLDMLIYGIPMEARIGDDLYQLESGGMFEVYALDGTDTLRFDDQKRMEVRLNVHTEPKPGMEGFKYDPAEGYWDSHTSKIDKWAVSDDDDLWGSSMAQQEVMVNMEENDPFGAFEYVEDTVRSNIFQTMEISEFGFYNYDRIIESEEYIYLTPLFVSNKKTPIKSDIYVVYDDINTVFYYPEYTWSDQFFLIKEKPYKLFTINDKGEVLRLANMPDLATIEGQQYTFVLDKQIAIATDRNSLAQLTGIQ